MEPRLPFSSKWTPIPDELADQMTEIFQETFASYLKKGRIFVEGRIYLRELLLRVGYMEKGRLRQDNFEVSIEYVQDKDNMMKMIHLGVDCAASMLEQFFGQPGEVDFPRSWKNFEVDGRQVYLQYTTVNTELESAADELLGEGATDALMRGEDLEDAVAAKKAKKKTITKKAKTTKKKKS